MLGRERPHRGEAAAQACRGPLGSENADMSRRRGGCESRPLDDQGFRGHVRRPRVSRVLKARPTGVVEMDERLIFPHHRQRTETAEAWGANTPESVRLPFGGRGARWDPLVVGQRRSDASGQPAAGGFPWSSVEPVAGKIRGVGARRDDGALRPETAIRGARKASASRRVAARTPKPHWWSGREYQSDRANPGQGTRQLLRAFG